MNMMSLKQLLDTEPKELCSWYNKYRTNLVHLLESIDIDTIHGMPSYRLLIADEYKEYASLFTDEDLYGSSSSSFSIDEEEN